MAWVPLALESKKKEESRKVRLRRVDSKRDKLKEIKRDEGKDTTEPGGRRDGQSRDGAVCA